MQVILPFLTQLARSNGLAFLVAFGILIVCGTPFIWRARRAERRYLLQPGNKVPAGGSKGRMENTDRQASRIATYTPQEGGKVDATPRLPTRQSTE